MKIGSMLGSAALIVMDEDRDIVQALAVIMEFFAGESCGQCTPCREGSAWSMKVLREIAAGRGKPRDIDDLLEVAQNMDGTTICPMGAGAACALRSFLTKFRGEFERAVSRPGPRAKAGGEAAA